MLSRLFLFLCASAWLLAQQKPAVTPAAFAKWETLGAGDLSPDGKWLAYSIRRVNSDEELRVASVNGAGKETVAAFGRRPVFSDDSRFLAYAIGLSEAEQDKLKKAKKPVEEKLGVLNLGTGETMVIEKVAAFAFSKGGRFLAMQKYPPQAPPPPTPAPPDAPKDPPGTTLVVRDLQAGADATFGNVSSYGWSEAGTFLAMTISAEGKTGNGVEVFNPASAQLRVLDSGAALYKGLAWRKDSNDLAALKSKPADLTIESAVSTDVQVQIYGTTAIVTGLDTISGKNKGESYTNRWLYMDVWVKRSGRWQCVKTYSTLANKK